MTIEQLNTDHLNQCIKTLAVSLQRLQMAEKKSLDYEVFRNATIKGFELTLGTSGKLLRKVLKTYIANPREIDELNYKDIFRTAAKQDISVLRQAFAESRLPILVDVLDWNQIPTAFQDKIKQHYEVIQR